MMQTDKGLVLSRVPSVSYFLFGFGKQSLLAPVAAGIPGKITDLLINAFFTIGHHNRDLDAILPGN